MKDFDPSVRYNPGSIVRFENVWKRLDRQGVWRSISPALKPEPSDAPIPGPPGKDGVKGDGYRHLGKFKLGQQYERLDCVEVSGSSYVCTIRTRDKPPSSAWNLLCKAGEDGTTEHLYTTVNRVFNRTVPGSGEAEPITAIFDDNVVRGQILYVPSDGHVALARANAQATAGAVGIALSDTNAGQAGTYRTEGTISDLSGLPSGAVFYLSADIAGAWTTVAPNSGGLFVTILGRALSGTEFDVSILPPS